MQVFEIAPAGMRPLWILLPVALLLLLAFGVAAASALGSNRARFELSPEGLRLRGDLYGRFVPAAQLRGGSARVVDLTREHELQPRRRTFGTALPGYRAGWFRLRNGERALLYLTDTHRAVYVPTRGDYVLLLSPRDPDAFVRALRSVSPAP